LDGPNVRLAENSRSNAGFLQRFAREKPESEQGI